MVAAPGLADRSPRTQGRENPSRHGPMERAQRLLPQVPGRFFSPQSQALGIDQDHYSPEFFKTIVYAGTQLTSFAQRSAALEALAACVSPPSKSSGLPGRSGRNVSNNVTRPFKRFWRCR